MFLRLAAAAAAVAGGTLFAAHATAAVNIPKLTCDGPRPDCTKCLTFPATGLTWGVCVLPE